MTQNLLKIPKFKTQSAEADWWASSAGRDYVERKSGADRRQGTFSRGSALVARLNKKSVQIALRLPEADLAKARELAVRKGIGYQTLLKMLVHEGLAREAGGDAAPPRSYDLKFPRLTPISKAWFPASPNLRAVGSACSCSPPEPPDGWTVPSSAAMAGSGPMKR